MQPLDQVPRSTMSKQSSQSPQPSGKLEGRTVTDESKTHSSEVHKKVPSLILSYADDLSDSEDRETKKRKRGVGQEPEKLHKNEESKKAKTMEDDDRHRSNSSYSENRSYSRYSDRSYSYDHREKSGYDNYDSRSQSHYEDKYYSDHYQKPRYEDTRKSNDYDYSPRTKPPVVSKNSGPKMHSFPMAGAIYLQMIQSGAKRYEGRINGPLCRKINIGDKIKFFDRKANWGIICEVMEKIECRTFDEMLDKVGEVNLLPHLKDKSSKPSPSQIRTEALKIYKGFPGSQRVNTDGCVAIGVKFLEKIFSKT